MQRQERGEQGRTLYEFLQRQAPGRGIEIGEMARLLDTSEDRIRQLLAKIRSGKLSMPHRRDPNSRYPSLSIDYNRKTGLYYNLSNLSPEAVREGVPAEIVNSMIDRLVAQALTLEQTLDGLRNNPEAAAQVLSRLSGDKRQEVDNALTGVIAAKRELERSVEQRRRDETQT